MGIFFTADLHLGHSFVANTRGFDNVADHDRMIISNLRKTVGHNDELFVLGDVALGGWMQNIVQLGTVNCTKHLIVGNHDRCFAGASNGHNHLNDVMIHGNFKSVQPVANYGSNFIMSHFPYEDIHIEGQAGRFVQYRLRDEGKPILHGHTHTKEKFSLSSIGTPQIHVGLDAWDLMPVSLGNVMALFKDANDDPFYASFMEDFR